MIAIGLNYETNKTISKLVCTTSVEQHFAFGSCLETHSAANVSTTTAGTVHSNVTTNESLTVITLATTTVGLGMVIKLNILISVIPLSAL
jgi:hypothetical protein